MEGIGSEVSQKIRAAIKAKLIELGAYVDDELPDYIMVMVANKRTKLQMDDDLQLFLASNTKIFTTWLHTVLQKLQEVTVANFEAKKDSNEKKSSKRKKESDSDGKSKRSPEDEGKKHSRKHKEAKKAKKSKHKSKEKVKIKPDRKDSGNDEKDKQGKELGEEKASHESEKVIEEKSSKTKAIQLNEAVGKAILGSLKKNIKSDRNDGSNKSCSPCEGTSNENIKHKKKSVRVENDEKNTHLNEKVLNAKKEGETEDAASLQNESKKLLIEDEFNIEPLKPAEKCGEKDLREEDLKDAEGKSICWPEVQHEKTISVPTEKLLKEHNKLLKEKSVGNEKAEEEKKSDSEESISPEEMRKQLLLSRAKKKLEDSKLAERMKSNSPDILILDETSRTVSKDFCQSSSKPSELRPPKSTPPPSDTRDKNSAVTSPKKRNRFSQSSNSSDFGKNRSPMRSPSRKRSTDWVSRDTASRNKCYAERRNDNGTRTRRRNSSSACDRDTEKRQLSNDRERRKNTTSESVQKKKDAEKSREKEVTSTKKRSISSRVVTITGPEAPEIPSIVKVKPREFIAKDKQANKALILKAVADAEKSIATIPARAQPEPEPKKDALFTKDLRGKRFEKLAVTLSNIQKSPDYRERMNRRVSVDSDKSERSRVKLDSSEISEGHRGKSDLLSRKIPKSDDHFISSKTTVMEKNDKYIRCWLEGVEKAVKEEEMVNPDEMEELIIHSNFSFEESESLDEGFLKKETEKKRRKPNEDETSGKTQKLSDKEIYNLRMIPNSRGEEDDDDDDGPEIVVTLDGLDSKTVKDIIQRNKESINGPVMLSRKEKDAKEKVSKISQRLSCSGKEKSPPNSRKSGFEKISDRFGRLNKANDDDEEDEDEDFDSEKSRSETKNIKHKEKEETNVTKSKNRQLIAQLSEKFGKVDRKFENKKRRYPEEDKRIHLYESRRSEREDGERNGKYKKSDRRWNRTEGTSSSPPPKFTSSSSVPKLCKFSINCKNLDCRYYHPKKCRFDEDCAIPDCKYGHSDPDRTNKSKWYGKS